VFKFTIAFNDPESAKYDFEFGVDFVFGGSVFVNNKWVVSRTADLWWAGNWASGAVIRFIVNAKPGLTLIEVFGGEGCCDGQNNIRFKRNEGSW
jgi:hypothetical protein